MKAHLVTFRFTTRVVVPDDADEGDILASGIENMQKRMAMSQDDEFTENCTEIIEDTDVPYDKRTDFPGQFGFYDKRMNK